MGELFRGIVVLICAYSLVEINDSSSAMYRLTFINLVE